MLEKIGIIAICETRITKQVSISLFEVTQTETSAGGTLPYIANHLSYKCHNDLNIYKNNEMESIFVEVFNPRESNIIT